MVLQLGRVYEVAHAEGLLEAGGEVRGAQDDVADVAAGRARSASASAAKSMSPVDRQPRPGSCGATSRRAAPRRGRGSAARTTCGATARDRSTTARFVVKMATPWNCSSRCEDVVGLEVRVAVVGRLDVAGALAEQRVGLVEEQHHVAGLGGVEGLAPGSSRSRPSTSTCTRDRSIDRARARARARSGRPPSTCRCRARRRRARWCRGPCRACARSPSRRARRAVARCGRRAGDAPADVLGHHQVVPGLRHLDARWRPCRDRCRRAGAPRADDGARATARPVVDAAMLARAAAGATMPPTPRL